MKVSIVIPARNEPYLQKTILDLLKKASGDIEIIAVLDGYWPPSEKIVDDKRVKYIHYAPARGMRNAINAGVAIANGEFILKCDAHVMFGEGFDEILQKDCNVDYVVVPRRYALLPETWEIEKNPKYPIDYMYLDKELHGQNWPEKNKNPEFEKVLIDDLMSSQGSCWFMKKSYFEKLELMDEENYGMFSSEFQEIGLKCWLSGGRVVVNKKTWYAHWHKTEGRGYSLDKEEFEKGNKFTENWRTFNKAWDKQTLPLGWLYKKFGREEDYWGSRI